ncbi:MAG: hypothetical protein ACWGNI_00980 [Desulfobacterales bacterium]
MNDTTIRQYRAGFKMDDTLASRINFSGIIRAWEKNHIVKESPEGDIEYWTIKDEYGLRLTCFYEELVSKLVIGERYEISGEVKIGKGATFLNLKKAKIMNGGDFDG